MIIKRKGNRFENSKTNYQGMFSASGLAESSFMYTYMGTYDNTTDLAMTFLALLLLHIESKMAGAVSDNGPAVKV